MKEPKNLGDKIWRKTSEIEIWNINCRNEFTGGKLREGNWGSESVGVKLQEWDSMEQNVGTQILKTIKGERKGELNGGDIKGKDVGF